MIQMARLMLVAMLVALLALVGYAWRRHGGTGRGKRTPEAA